MSKGNEEASSRSQALLTPFYDICHRKYLRGDLVERPSKSDQKTMEVVLGVGRYYAMGASVLTFLLLRKLPKFHMNNTIKTLQAKGLDFPQNSTTSSISMMPRITSRLDGRSVFQEGIVGGFFLTILDAAVACVIGGATWYYMTPQDQLCESASKIPLAAGKSMLADTFCSDFIDQYQRMDPGLWANQNDKDEDFIQGILGFIENCYRRRIYEDHLRAEQGLPKEAPIEIPPPGVPPELLIGEDGDMGHFSDTAQRSHETHFS